MGFDNKFKIWLPYWKMVDGFYKSGFIFLSLGKTKVKSLL